ncbi:RING/FYVE/PHD zinc finger superfamily protein [Striga asiatica]|uniref:RING/FYVE/PHD zinc finger superfamily protein n=1 Tax=Striga asiatica TaxID=4170 RepID=A0A5A7Q2N7_STRAF|nr:RING/FYVE/PHD zinc finger superfamily protein [Striga asiatica]
MLVEHSGLQFIRCKVPLYKRIGFILVLLLSIHFACLCFHLQCMHGPKCKLGNFCTTGRRLQEANVLGGLILPVWGTIEKALSKQFRQSHKRLRVVRIETTADSQRIVGLLIPNAAVESVLQGLSVFRISIRKITTTFFVFPADLAWVQDVDDE